MIKMKYKTLNDWIKKYEDKTKEKFESKKGFKLFYLPERGFCEYRVENDMVMIYQLSGDGKFWRDFGLLLAQLTGCRHMGTICVRNNIKAYIRFWGYEIEQKERLPEGLVKYHCRQKETGKTAVCSPAWTDNEKNLQAYFITWEV